MSKEALSYLNSIRPIRTNAAANAAGLVWVGDNGDIREDSEGPVIGWATEDGTMMGARLPFRRNAMQPHP